MMNLLEINERIGQRPPFQMIERVLEIEPNKSALGIKNVSVNEPYFMGHFPGTPIMPGVLVIESCAQLCSIVISPEQEEPDRLYVLLKVDGFKFLRPIIPGDTMKIAVTAERMTKSSFEFSAVVTVDGQTRAKGSMLFTSIPRDSVYPKE